MKTNSVIADSKIRKATKDDADNLFRLIDALADFEKLSRPDSEARKRFINDAFGANPKINIWLSEVDNKAVGYAIYFFTYSSFLARQTLYLEDIFVLPEYRSKGLGKILFKHCAQIALEENCGRMEWQVLDWNKPAIDFYVKSGAKYMKEWLSFRFTREDLERIV